MKSILTYFCLMALAFIPGVVDAIEKNGGTSFIDCDSVILNRQDALQEIRRDAREQKSGGTERYSPNYDTLPNDHPCNINIDHVCAKYDTGKRCVMAPCLDVYKLIDFDTSCAACRVSNVLGVYDKPCSKVQAAEK